MVFSNELGEMLKCDIFALIESFLENSAFANYFQITYATSNYSFSDYRGNKKLIFCKTNFFQDLCEGGKQT